MVSVIGCTVIAMENYRTGFDDGNDLDFIDFDLLVQNLEVCLFSSFLCSEFEAESVWFLTSVSVLKTRHCRNYFVSEFPIPENCFILHLVSSF